MKKDKFTKNIMIVDDDKSILNLMGIVVSDLGYSVTFVEDSRKVFYEIGKKKPDLIFLDLIMPVLDGEEILKMFKKDKSLSTIPVILLSASNTIEDIAATYKVAGFIKKPFDLDKLYSLIEENI